MLKYKYYVEELAIYRKRSNVATSIASYMYTSVFTLFTFQTTGFCILLLMLELDM